MEQDTQFLCVGTHIQERFFASSLEMVTLSSRRLMVYFLTNPNYPAVTDRLMVMVIVRATSSTFFTRT